MCISDTNVYSRKWQCISNTNVYSRKCTFSNPAPEGRTDTLQLTYIPQLLQECYRVLASLISWPGRLLSLKPCRRPKFLARMLFLGATDIKQIGTLPKGWQLKSSIKSFVTFRGGGGEEGRALRLPQSKIYYIAGGRRKFVFDCGVITVTQSKGDPKILKRGPNFEQKGDQRGPKLRKKGPKVRFFQNSSQRANLLK